MLTLLTTLFGEGPETPGAQIRILGRFLGGAVHVTQSQALISSIVFEVQHPGSHS